MENCQNCQGSGTITGSDTCPACGGVGSYPEKMTASEAIKKFYSTDDYEVEDGWETDVGGTPIAGDLTLNGKVIGSWGPTTNENWVLDPETGEHMNVRIC